MPILDKTGISRFRFQQDLNYFDIGQDRGFPESRFRNRPKSDSVLSKISMDPEIPASGSI